MTWVVVSDPVPGGATHAGQRPGPRLGHRHRGEKREGSGLAGLRGAQLRGLPQLLRVPAAGAHEIEYTVRLNNPGRFALPPTRVEAMYAPEMFGEAPNARGGGRGGAVTLRCPAHRCLRCCCDAGCGQLRWPADASTRCAPRTGRRTRCCSTATASRCRRCASTPRCAAGPGWRWPRCRRRCARPSCSARTGASTSTAASTGGRWPRAPGPTCGTRARAAPPR